MRAIVLLVMSLACAGGVHAQAPAGTCPATVVSAVAARLGLPASVGAPVALACKPWPKDRAVLLATMAWARPGGAEVGNRVFDHAVAMLDAETHVVLALHHAALEEDAVFELMADGLRLDTARYDLAPDVRAFGVVQSSSARGASCPDRRFGDVLTLFVRQGTALRPVLETALQATDFVEGSPCDWEGPLVEDSAGISLRLANTRSHGMADIVLDAAIVRSRRDQASAATRRAHKRLRYDGRVYPGESFENASFWMEERHADE